MPFETSDTPTGEHEFDPYGTLVFVLAYFVILLLAWVYMYFVEFLGNDPTVIGGMFL